MEKQRFSLYIFLFLLGFSGRAFADPAAEWLVTQVQTDGSISTENDIATSFQSTAESINALSVHEYSESPGYSNALQYLQAADYGGVEHLARRIAAHIEAEGGPGELATQLAASQNADGGFGELPGYHSTVTDTAFALEALVLAKYGDDEALGRAVSFLAARRSPGGGWAPDPAQPASVYVTARVLNALWLMRHRVDLGTLLGEARAVLLDQRDRNGAWNGPFETAAALIALYPTEQDKTRLAESKQQLLAWQLADGSWAQDAFVTALAMRALAAAEESFADLGVVAGRVVDGDTGSPLAGVSVELSGGQVSTTDTDSSGVFRLEDLSPDSYRLTLSLENYAPLSTPIEIRTGTRIALGTLQMLRSTGGADTATITGQVTHGATGEPLDQVRVGVTGSDSHTLTGDDGRYQLQGLVPGTVTLTAEKVGFQQASATTELSAGEVALFSPALPIEQPVAASVEGQVTRAEDGSPLPGVDISVSNDDGNHWQATTDVAGLYRIEGLPAGTFTLLAELDGYWPASAETTIESSSVVRFAPALSEQSAEQPAPPPTGGMLAVVRDAISGQALTGATLEVTVGDHVAQGQTDEEGRLSLMDLPVGDATAIVAAEDFRPWQQSFEVDAGIVLDFGEVELYPLGYLEPAGIRGSVIDATGGQPLSDVAVEAHFGGMTYTTTSDAEGHFEFDGLADTEGELVLSRSGHQSVEFGLVLIPGRLLELGPLRMRPEAITELKPDLIAERLDLSDASYDAQRLFVSGSAVVTMQNAGTANATGPLEAIAFFDASRDGVFDSDTDTVVGRATFPGDLPVGSEATLSIDLDAALPFRDAPLRVWVDSAGSNVELSEENNYAGSAGRCGGEESLALDLAMCMDASGSVSWSEFQLQLEGTAAAIEDPEIVPHDGSVRLTVLQFSSSTRVEVKPTVITDGNAAQVADRIRGIYKRGGGTSIHSCINTAVSQLTAAIPESAIQVIDVSTDGHSSAYYAKRASQCAGEGHRHPQCHRRR